MRDDQLIYWGLVVISASALCLGVWLGFFAREFLERRASLAKERLGKKACMFFVVSLRVLGVFLIIPSAYIFIGLMRIMTCAIKH